MDYAINTLKLYNALTNILIEKKYDISTMESCTSGLIATLFTNRPHASEILKGAFITYCNEAKIMQGVSKDVIDKYGVYSKETAIEMALNCKKTYNSHIGIGVTGVLDRVDPSNPTTDKYVYYAIIMDDKVITQRYRIPNHIIDRYDRKMWVAGSIGTELYKLLTKDER